MDYEKLTTYLTEDEQAAIDTLEQSGWEIFLGAKIEDTHLKDGGRRRTFRKEGRYNLCITCRRVDDPHRRVMSDRLKSERAYNAGEAGELRIVLEKAQSEGTSLKKALREARAEAKNTDAELAAVKEELFEAIAAANTGGKDKESPAKVDAKKTKKTKPAKTGK